MGEMADYHDPDHELRSPHDEEPLDAIRAGHVGWPHACWTDEGIALSGTDEDHLCHVARVFAALDEVDDERIRWKETARRVTESAKEAQARLHEVEAERDALLEGGMTTPRTPTGKRLWGNKRRLMVPADILAIEAEAIAIGAKEAEDEAERLADALERRSRGYHASKASHVGTWENCTLVACHEDQIALRLHDERVKP